MATKPSVRSATAADGPVIATFNALMALETEQRNLDHETLRRGVEAVLSNPSKGTYYIAELDGTVVGQLLITYEWSDWRNGMFWWIQSVYVREEYRNKGIFKTLFRHVESESKRHSGVAGLRLYVEKENTKAKQTYERLSMKKTPYEIYEIDYVLTDGKKS